MTLTTGTVDCIQVADDYCFFSVIEEATGESETFIMWFAPNDPSAFTRVMHSMWLSFAREALTTGLPVTVGHQDDSAAVVTLQLNRTTA